MLRARCLVPAGSNRHRKSLLGRQTPSPVGPWRMGRRDAFRHWSRASGMYAVQSSRFSSKFLSNQQADMPAQRGAEVNTRGVEGGARLLCCQPAVCVDLSGAGARR